METDNAESKLLFILRHEPWQSAVEHRHSAPVSDWRVSCNDAVSVQPLYVYPVSDICLMEDVQFDISLSHPM